MLLVTDATVGSSREGFVADLDFARLVSNELDSEERPVLELGMLTLTDSETVSGSK